MFTGIVAGTALVTDVIAHAGHTRLVVEVPQLSLLEGAKTGGSIAINGTCLTIVAVMDRQVSFDVIKESLEKTNLSDLEPGSVVNFERAARFGDEIGGHLLSGHIQTQATVEQIIASKAEYSIHLSLSDEYKKYVLYKGYVAVDGCSLTVGKLTEKGFWLHLIPETLRLTNLSSRERGARINIEIDSQTQAVVDTVERYMREKAGA